MTSQMATWLIGLVGTVAIPRFLGAELVGRFHLANSIWAVAAVVMALGMDLALTKAVARDPQSIGSMLTASLTARLLAALPVAVLVFVYAVLAGYPNEVLGLLVIVGVGAIVLTTGDAMAAVLKGLDRMSAISVAAILGRLAFVGGAVLLLALGYSIYAVAIVAGAGNAVMLAILLSAFRRARAEVGDNGGLRVSRTQVAELVRESMPYLWIALAISVYLQVDTIIISLLVENDEVLGWYSVYDRLGGTLMFVPTVFITAVYPTLARLYGGTDDDKSHQHNRLTEKTFQVMLLISVPIGFGLLAISRPLVQLLFGDDFVNAAPVLAVGGFVTSLTYLTTVLGMFLISMDRQRLWTRFIVLGAALTIPLDLVLVPYFQSVADNGAIGGAVAYAITESIMLGGAIYLLPRGALGHGSGWYAIRVVAAGAVMAAAIFPFRDLFIAVPIVLGALVYTACIAALRLIDAEDRRLLLTSVPLDLLPTRLRSR